MDKNYEPSAVIRKRVNADLALLIEIAEKASVEAAAAGDFHGARISAVEAHRYNVARVSLPD